MGVIENDQRNEIIVKLTKALLGAGEVVLILIKKLKHGEELLRRFDQEGISTLMSSGANKITKYEGGRISRAHGGTDKIKDQIESGALQVVIGSVIYGEGMDIPKLSAMIMAAAGKSDTQIIQRAYRAMTASSGKDHSFIFDFMDATNPMLRNQSNVRMKLYQDEDIRVVTQLPLTFRKLIGAPI